MKFLKGLFYGFVLCLFFSTSWALKTKFDPRIYEKDLKEIGIHNVSKIKSDLALSDEKQALIVKHAVTTGRDKANQNSIMIDIKALEQITPKVAALSIIRSQKPLTTAQVDSLIQILKSNNMNVPDWLSDKKQNKYLNIVLEKENDTNGNIFPLTTREARALLNWSIKHKHIVKEDHPA